MTDYEDVEDWFGFSVDATGLNFPTQDQVTQFIAIASSKFKSLTGVTYDDSVDNHVELLQMLIEKHIKGWFKIRAGFAESFSNPAGSVSHSNMWVFYDKERFNYLVTVIKGISLVSTYL